MNPNEPWTLAIDFGTTYTVSAIRVPGQRPEVIEIAGERRVPSAIFADHDGRVIAGRAADDLAASHPDRAVRALKGHLGDPSPVVLGGRPYRAVDLVGALLLHVYGEALRYQGSAPSEVRLTHPAMWSRPRLSSLLEAAATARLPNPLLISEPVAAAVTYADEVGMRAGGHVAVYDLGGGTFDTAALRAGQDGFVVIGRPSGDTSMGGELFDELLANHAGERLAPDVWEQLQISNESIWQRASANLRSEARRVKELLSAQPHVDMLIGLPDGLVQQRITQRELDTLIDPYVRESVEVLARCVSDAGLEPALLDAIYLVGGSSRVPLVERLVAERFPGVRVSRRGDPKTSVALGATRVTTAMSLGGALAAAPAPAAATSANGPARAPRRPAVLVGAGAAAAGVLIAAIALATHGASSKKTATTTTTSNQQLAPSQTTPTTTIAVTAAVTGAPATTVARTPASTVAPATTIAGTAIVPPPTDDPLSQNVVRTFTAYFSSINNGDYERARLRNVPARRATAEAWAASLGTTHDSDIVIRSVTPVGGGAASAWVTFTSVQAPEKGPHDQPCTRWSIDYRLVPADDGLLWLDGAVAHPGDEISQACK